MTNLWSQRIIAFLYGGACMPTCFSMLFIRRHLRCATASVSESHIGAYCASMALTRMLLYELQVLLYFTVIRRESRDWVEKLRAKWTSNSALKERIFLKYRRMKEGSSKKDGGDENQSGDKRHSTGVGWGVGGGTIRDLHTNNGWKYGEGVYMQWRWFIAGAEKIVFRKNTCTSVGRECSESANSREQRLVPRETGSTVSEWFQNTCAATRLPWLPTDFRPFNGQMD